MLRKTFENYVIFLRSISYHFISFFKNKIHSLEIQIFT